MNEVGRVGRWFGETGGTGGTGRASGLTGSDHSTCPTCPTCRTEFLVPPVPPVPLNRRSPGSPRSIIPSNPSVRFPYSPLAPCLNLRQNIACLKLSPLQSGLKLLDRNTVCHSIQNTKVTFLPMVGIVRRRVPCSSRSDLRMRIWRSRLLESPICGSRPCPATSITVSWRSR